jgi:negative regulator of sigma E activity
MRLSAGLLLLFLTLAPSAYGATASERTETALSLLHAAVDAPQHVSFVGQVELLEIGSHGSEASIFRVEHRAPDLTRRWYLAPRNLYGDSTISRSDTVYAIDVEHKQIVVTQNEAFGIHFGWARNLGLLIQNYRPVSEPDQTVAGRPVDVIRLVNRYSGATTMRLWTDENTNLMLRREVYASDGSVVLQMHFDSVRFTNDIPVSTFATPKGYRIVNGPSRGAATNNPYTVIAKAGFTPRAPHYLPEGFVAVGADLADQKGVHILHLLYSDGLRTVSLFENAKGAAVDASGYRTQRLSVGHLSVQAVDQGATTLLAWSDGRLHYALVGDLGESELEKIAASITP